MRDRAEPDAVWVHRADCGAFPQSTLRLRSPTIHPQERRTLVMKSTAKAKANPTKHFFVNMLTRDISLEDCILDLVDNSLDQAWANSGVTPGKLTKDSALAQFQVELQVSSSQFSITDNCGGMTFDDAAEYAFNFGRDSDRELDEYTVGVYGIGMKRAIFKLGKLIEVRSHPTGEQAFRVPIDVDDWLSRSNNDWDFDIESDDPLPSPGVSISVGQLHPDVADQFGAPEFEKRLRRILGRDYLIPLMRGLTITVNGNRVESWEIELVHGAGFQPMRQSFSDGAVEVEIIAGVLADEANADSESKDARSRGVQKSGWYVACNGRVVAAADTSLVTGWGSQLPKWHAQYNGFAGFVFFVSKNAALLPMTTTKRDVDVSSGLYRRVLVRHMVPVSKAWTKFTNAVKDGSGPRVPTSTAAVQIEAAAESRTIALPSVTKSRVEVANVNYSVSLKRMKELATGFGDVRMPFREVGLRSFDFAYEEYAEGEG